MELAAFLGQYQLLEILYIEKVKAGLKNEKVFEDIKDLNGWNGQCFMESLINYFVTEIKKEFENNKERIPSHPVIDIYKTKIFF